MWSTVRRPSAALVRIDYRRPQQCAFGMSTSSMLKRLCASHLRLHVPEGFLAAMRASQSCLARAPPIPTLPWREPRGRGAGRSAWIRLELQLHRRHTCTIKQARCAVQPNGAVCMRTLAGPVATPSGPMIFPSSALLRKSNPPPLASLPSTSHLAFSPAHSPVPFLSPFSIQGESPNHVILPETFLYLSFVLLFR